jgi:uncharacterized protein (TIRG00374 family)
LKKKEVIKYLVFALIGALIVYFIQKDFNFSDFRKNLANAKLQYVLLSASVGVLAVFIRALRWRLLLKPLGYTTKLSNAYHATMSGYLVNLGIPRSGEVYRCAAFSKSDNVPINVLVGTVLSERILDLVMLVFVLVFSVVLQFDLLFNYINVNVLVKLEDKKWLLVLIAAIGIAAIIFLFRSKNLVSRESRIGKMFAGFLDGIRSVFTLQQPILFIIYTIGIWVCYWLMTYSILFAFDFTSHLGVGGGLSTLVFSTLGVIIPAPAGIATISSIEIGMHQIYSLTIGQANSVAIVMFFSNIAMIIFAGTISFITMAYRTKA